MNAWAKNFVVKDFIHLIFNEKQPHLFYMNNMCLCKLSQEAKLIEQRNFSELAKILCIEYSASVDNELRNHQRTSNMMNN